MVDAYFFDIDGTLLVTSDLVHWNGLHKAMLEVYGIDTTIEGLLYHGKTDIAILRNALSIWALPISMHDRLWHFVRRTPVCIRLTSNVSFQPGNVEPGGPHLTA